MRSVIAFSLVVVAPTLATAQAPNPTGEALRLAVAGKTVHIDTPIGTTLPVNYMPDGTLTGTAGALGFVLGAASDQGKWWIKGDRVCQRWTKWFDAETRCVLVRQFGRRIEWESDDGKSGTGTIVAMAAPVPPRTASALGGPKTEHGASLPQTAVLPPAMVPPVARKAPAHDVGQVRQIEARSVPTERKPAVAAARVVPTANPVVPAVKRSPPPANPQRAMHRQMVTVSKALDELAWCEVMPSQGVKSSDASPPALATMPKQAYASQAPALMLVSFQDYNFQWPAETTGAVASAGTCMSGRPSIGEVASYGDIEPEREPTIRAMAAMAAR